jgi:hypothetical protein
MEGKKMREKVSKKHNFLSFGLRENKGKMLNQARVSPENFSLQKGEKVEIERVSFYYS